MNRSKLAPIALLFAACTSSEETGPATNALTFWGDVAPIFNEKCVKCHQAGGIAPFRLDSYEEASRVGPAIAAEVGSGLKPPYLVAHDGSCGQFQADETLTTDQITKITTWAA